MPAADTYGTIIGAQQRLLHCTVLDLTGGHVVLGVRMVLLEWLGRRCSYYVAGAC